MKKYNELTLQDTEELKKRIDYNDLTGLFTWKINVGQRGRAGFNAGFLSKSTKYFLINFKSKQYRAHRIAWLFHYGEMPDLHIDHIDGNTLNNVISNLRLATDAQNLQNRKKPSLNNKTGFLGVFACNSKKNPYRASIMLNSKNIHIGCFTNAVEAHEAYLNEKRKIHLFCTI